MQQKSYLATISSWGSSWSTGSHWSLGSNSSSRTRATTLSLCWHKKTQVFGWSGLYSVGFELIDRTGDSTLTPAGPAGPESPGIPCRDTDGALDVHCLSFWQWWMCLTCILTDTHSVSGLASLSNSSSRTRLSLKTKATTLSHNPKIQICWYDFFPNRKFKQIPLNYWITLTNML